MCDPPVSDLWQWQIWHNQPYLICKLLDSWQHGFFTHAFAPQMPETLTHVFDTQISAYRVKQVHGNTVLHSSEVTWQGENFSNADGIVSDAAGQSVWVASADCTPALIGDLKTGHVAAIHAGWRGTAKRILPEAISKLLNNGSQLENLRVALGPAISGEVYQVSEDVAAEVGLSLAWGDFGDRHTPTALLEAMQALVDPPVLSDPEPGKVRLDVRRINQLQLEQLGLDVAQVAIAPHCTYQQPEHFFSYRRNNQKNVQWSGIVSATKT